MQPLCTNNPFHGDAQIVHHLHYRRSLLRRTLGLLLLNLPVKSISGFEIPGFDIVPICKECHQNSYGTSKSRRSLHYHKIWIQRGGIDNHQHWFTAWRLRINYFILFLWGIRSKELNLYPEHWGIPCGFLDWGESAYEAAEREVLEELGIKLSDFCFNINPQPDAVMSDPNPSENETVSLRFIVNCKVEELPELKTSSEVTEVKWMEVTRNGWKQEKLAFNHTDIIDWALCRSHIDGF